MKTRDVSCHYCRLGVSHGAPSGLEGFEDADRRLKPPAKPWRPFGADKASSSQFIPQFPFGADKASNPQFILLFPLVGGRGHE